MSAATTAPDGPEPPKELWAVLDAELGLVYAAAWPEACNEHINEALSEFDIDAAKHWVVRRYTLQEN